jgi:hypothetical protein
LQPALCVVGHREDDAVEVFDGLQRPGSIVGFGAIVRRDEGPAVLKGSVTIDNKT